MDTALPFDTSVIRGATKAPEPRTTSNPEEARETAEKFEAFFLSQVVEHMFAGVEPDPLFGGGQAEGVYRSMLFQEYGAAIARSGGIGISDMVQKEILRLQEVQQQ
ncbi:rod-binding protein [Rhodospirillaceae bacterium SYSU D60014]|uniref:rod-binding protein n=1 Tax=Virgifigura deserti TaxID=2268457 RepID=UPI000E66D50E